MKKHYHTLSLPANPLQIITRLDLKIFTLLDNGFSDYMIGFCEDSRNIYPINYKTDYHNLDSKSDYFFGYIPYEQAKYFMPETNFKNPVYHNFKAAKFFKADGVFIRKKNAMLFFGTNEQFRIIKSKLSNSNFTHRKIETSDIITLKAKTDEQQYIQQVESIKKLIQNGDIYEVNYCVTFESNKTDLSTINTFNKLKDKTNAPFSSLLQIEDTTIISGSPERFLNKSNNVLVSQPIKGTIKRGVTTSEDEALIKTLRSDQKELAENIMIVDLVRNDLSKIALNSSVNVQELCKIYSFKTVHQLISTITCKVPNDIKFADFLQALFPMGSMTGAPKHSAMKIIDDHENFSREVYSGAIGFLAPNKSFDFNVVIRSIVYNNNAKSLSISVGSAITAKSHALKEYNECLLKLEAVKSAIICK